MRRSEEATSSLFERGDEGVHAHSGEEYRQELRRGIERWGDRIRDLAWGRLRIRGWSSHRPVDPDAEIERDTLTCLGILSCTEHTERTLTEGFAEGAFAAWERARPDIYDEWMLATDPATLQPGIRPLFRAAADHVRVHPASGLSIEDRDRVADALEAPCGIRHERRLREVFVPDKVTPGEMTRRIAEVVRGLGLQPWKPPEPLDPIEPEEVSLVVWMGVLGQTADGHIDEDGDPHCELVERRGTWPAEQPSRRISHSTSQMGHRAV